MHYGPKYFTKNGRTTIKVRKEYREWSDLLGNRKALSYLDIAQVRAMYQCNTLPSKESKRTCIKKSTAGRDYRGTLSYTEKGVWCQPWHENYPHKSKFKLDDSSDGLGRHNHCRNPQGSRERPWCYTTKRQEEWQYCDLKFCED